MSESHYLQAPCTLDYTARSAATAGDVIQLPDGRAAVPANDLEADCPGAVDTVGIFRVEKTADIHILNGGRVYFDVSAGKAHFRPESGTPDFYVGIAVGDSPASQTWVDVDINEWQRNTIDLAAGAEWNVEATLGLGVTLLPGNGAKLEFDAVAEIAQAALYSARGVPASARPILEARFAIFNIGDDAALDINVGLASGSHATDFETIAAFAAVQLDGNDLSLNTHSDDGTTDRAPVDSEIDLVDDVYAEVWIDVRDPEDIKFYCNGVLINTSAAKRTLAAALATPLYAIAHIEKGNNDTVADVRVARLVVRTSVE